MSISEKFLQIYANLPVSMRQEIIIVVDQEPLTWNSVKIEVDSNTEKSKIILEKLKNIGIINL